MLLNGIGVFVGCVRLVRRRVVLVVVSLVRSMAVTVVKVVDMAAMLDCGVAAAWSVFVFMQLGLDVSPARDPAVQGPV